MDNQNKYLEDDGLENAGFSFIILMIVIMLIGVIVGFSLASYSPSNDDVKKEILIEEVNND